MAVVADLSKLPNDIVGLSTAVAALSIAEVEGQFREELNNALAKNAQTGVGSGAQGGVNPDPDAQVDPTAANPDTTVADSEYAQNILLMSLSHRLQFTTTMGKSIIDKSSEAKSNVAKAG
jgi:hypothetical protein